MERFLRNLCLIILLLSMFLLLGSGRSSKLPVERSEAERAALHIGKTLPKNDRNEWNNAVSKHSLWLIRVTSSAVPQ